MLGLGSKRDYAFFDNNLKTVHLRAKTCKRHPNWNIILIFLKFFCCSKIKHVSNGHFEFKIQIGVASLIFEPVLLNWEIFHNLFWYLYMNFLISLIVSEKISGPYLKLPWSICIFFFKSGEHSLIKLSSLITFYFIKLLTINEKMTTFFE